ncbi:MarR family winged helix-turn-helix transcriptional regulator [Cryptosporangium sp. NPDC048952]|uniref:MarR family winged helix-turn-helix transcriptional regulator n=1 Tax=Cryptosporangium sp. NPDC048952 TaxID=3363961 RepID=UPI00372277C3
MNLSVGTSAGSQLMPVLSQLVRLLRQLDAPDRPSLVAMAILRRLDREGAGRITDIARAERASQPGITQLVGRLERSSLVRRVQDPNDGRGVLVELTDGGRNLLAETQAHHVSTLDMLLDRLDDADRATIVAALPALTRLTQEAP